MSRLIYLEAQPYFRAKEVADQNQLAVITPTKTAARALGKQKRSLQDFAVQRLSRGTTIASPLEAQRALREAIHQAVQPHDIEGTARAWMPTVQALLRSSPSFNITLARL